MSCPYALFHDIHKIRKQTISRLDRSAGHAGFFREDNRVVNDDIGAEGNARAGVHHAVKRRS